MFNPWHSNSVRSFGALLLASALTLGPEPRAEEAHIGNERDMIEAYEAYAVYKTGQFEAAMTRFRALADKGNRQGMLNLAHMYAQGQGVAADPATALHWYRRAAELGEPIAMYYAGRSYAQGRGAGADPRQALRWYRAAAEAGLAEAQFELGKRLHREGQADAARRWLQAAADQGLTEARAYRTEAAPAVVGVDADTADAVRAALAAIDRAAAQRNAAGIVHYLAYSAQVRVRLPGSEVYARTDREGLGRLWQATFDQVNDYHYQRAESRLSADAGGVVAESVILETLGSAQGQERLRLHERAWFKAIDSGVEVRRLDLRIERLRRAPGDESARSMPGSANTWQPTIMNSEKH